MEDVKFVLPSGGPLHLTRLDLLKWQGESGEPAAGAVEEQARRCYQRIRRRTNGSVVALLDATMITRAEKRSDRRRRLWTWTTGTQCQHSSRPRLIGRADELQPERNGRGVGWHASAFC